MSYRCGPRNSGRAIRGAHVKCTFGRGIQEERYQCGFLRAVCWCRPESNSNGRLAVSSRVSRLLCSSKCRLMFTAGFHEVACTTATLEVRIEGDGMRKSLLMHGQAMSRRRSEHPDRPSNRISSTFFWHLSSDHLLEPDLALSKMAEDRFGHQKEYGSMLVGEQVQRSVIPTTKASVRAEIIESSVLLPSWQRNAISTSWQFTS